MLRFIIVLFVLSACVPHHTKKQEKQILPTDTVHIVFEATPPVEVAITALPKITLEIEPISPVLPVLLEGLSADDLTMLEKRAVKNFPERHWQVVANNAVFVHRRVVDVLHDMGAPIALQMVPAVESKYNPYAVSARGAAGLWQFMPTTARAMGLKCNTKSNDLRHVEKSTRAATQYLQRLQQRFIYWPLALAAYNCGPARLAKFLRKQGGWKPSDGLNALPAPKASKAYVKNILSLAYAQHQGLRTFPKSKPIQRVQQQGLDVRQLGKDLHIPFETILRLNPELERIRYAKNTTLTLCLPQLAPWDRVVSSKTTKPIMKARYIRVKSGDSWWRIARRYDVQLQKLRLANPTVGKVIQPKQRLKLPNKAAFDRMNPLLR